MQAFPEYQQPVSQTISFQMMQERLQKQRMTFIVLLLVVAVIAFMAGFFIEGNIWHQWFQSSCTSYPFLLLNPSTHMACTLPTP